MSIKPGELPGKLYALHEPDVDCVSKGKARKRYEFGCKVSIATTLKEGFTAVVDGLKGFPQAIEAAFPQTRIHTCIVHLLRHSMNFASYKDRKAVAAALKAIYTAVDADAAELALVEFEDSDLARRYPAIAPSWRRGHAYPTPARTCPRTG